MLEVVNERPSSHGGGSTDGASSPLPLPYRFGRYRLTKLLALGGMAQIYLAKSFGAEGFVKQLVIKRLDPRLANEPFFTDLFINEAKLLVTLSHGNIVPVFDFGRVDDRDLFIAMEHVDGVSLRTLLATLQAKRRKLDPQLAAYITAEICKGLHYAHRKTDMRGRLAGIVHRDIKPTNILLSMEGEVKIVDFGVAKLSGRLESRGRLAGTLAYMSPEQANRTTKIDRRTDIFSTGLVLYEMLLGRRPYQAVAPREMLEEARRALLPELSDEVPRELARVAELATQREISQRYASAYEMEQAVSEYLLLARAATAILDSQSPNFKLSALIKELGLGRDDASDADSSLTSGAELDAPTPSAVSLDSVTDGGPHTEPQRSLGAGLSDLDKPPDLDMMRGAAETFQSEFFTRVLQEEIEPSRNLLKWAVVAASAAVVLLIATLVITQVKSGRGAGAGSATGSAASAAGSASGSASASGAVVDHAGSGSASPSAKLTDAGASARARKDAKATPSKLVTPARADAGADTTRRKRRRRVRYGYLNINAIPWARVRVDGRLLGRPTPILKLRLRAGGHRLELFNKALRKRKRLRVWIRPGATTWRVVRLAGAK